MMKSGLSMNKGWSTHTKESVVRTGRTAKKTLRTMRNEAQRLTRNIRGRLQREILTKNKTSKSKKFGRRVRRGLHEKEDKSNSILQKPPQVNISMESLPSEDPKTSYAEQLKHLSSVSLASHTRRDSYISQATQTSLPTSVEEFGSSNLHVKAASNFTKAQYTDVSTSDTTGKTLKEPYEKSITPTKTWPTQSGETSLTTISAEQEKTIQKDKIKAYLLHYPVMVEDSQEHVDENVRKLRNPSTRQDDINTISNQIHHNLASVPRLRKRFSPEDMAERLQAVQIQRSYASLNTSKDSGEFAKLWEKKLLPAIKKELQDIDGGYSVNVLRGTKPGDRIIDVMTVTDLKSKIIQRLKSEKDNCLPDAINERTIYEFSKGKIEFTSSTETRNSEDSWLSPKNVRRYTDPKMGDSVGALGIGGSATLGPLLDIRNKLYWLLNWHTFDDKGRNRGWKNLSPPSVEAVHPSEDDLKNYCEPERHCSRIGKPVAFSGPMYNTSQPSKLMRNSECFSGEDHSEIIPAVVTDWILLEAAPNSGVNKVRLITEERRCDSFGNSITNIAEPKFPCCSPFQQPRLVYSTGRTSGLSKGQICEILGCQKLWNGLETRNWAIEDILDDSIQWNLGGMGVPGDSGAGVVDLVTNRLVGQIWGRNYYSGKNQRVTFFTTISDIYDDIQRQMPSEDRPMLPREDSIPMDMGSGQAAPLGSISEHADTPKERTHVNINSQAAGHSFAASRRSSSQAAAMVQSIGHLMHRTVVCHASSW